ncbi:helix-turn-helix transcriptional regulator [Kibdelosporangium persicum]|uniref:HTH cro/C1-type domain-containing protein n=1 Tax=Kibdelosporangium persicum TaxID=2698649 RepID=A0ABX2F2A2_9PSEU|nr:helix-turn-helix transcriptional regulator [Kibdelosporangium persicum]NRN65427.1 hypothetical protein [Kibdelosporangium persicum]
MSDESRSLSPLVLRERLADYLRRAREDKGWSQSSTANKMGWSLSKLQRIETAVVSVSWTDTKALVELYGLRDDTAAQHLLAMARQARRRDRFTPFKKHLTAEYQTLLSYEESALRIRSANSFVLPGLLQVPRYARALLSVKHSGAKLDALVKARQVRQQILDDPQGPRFEFLIDEAMLYRQIGGPDVLAAQLTRLLEISGRPNLTLRVIPFAAGAHLGLWEPFMIMTIPGGSLDAHDYETIVYRETGDSEYLIRTGDERINLYRTSFTEIEAQTLSPSETRDLIERARSRLGTPEAAAPDSAR